MAAKGTTFSGDLLKLVFQATTIANLAINATSSPLTSLYVSLHTASPGAGGDQTTNELSYTGYARVAVTRDNTGFTVTSNSVSPAANVSFGQRADASTGTATYFAIGTASSGAGKLLYFGQITSPSGGIIVGQYVTPILTTASAVTES